MKTKLSRNEPSISSVSYSPANSDKKKQAFLSTIPIGRFSTPQDMGNAACFLCSDEASMITGVVLEVDGGRCI